MNREKRNIVIAVVLLIVLLIAPFWPRLKAAVSGEDAVSGASTAQDGTDQSDGETGASPDRLACTVTVTFSGAEEDLDAAVRDVLPSDGLLLPETAVTVSSGATVLDALQTACAAAEVSVVTGGSPAYVTSIGGLAEGDGGAASGWTYQVDGTSPTVGAGELAVTDGASIVWQYVTRWE